MPGSKLSKPAPILIGRDLTVRDVKVLARFLNEKGEFQSLQAWAENLSEAELKAWVSFINQWVYEEALSPKGFIQILKEKIGLQSFSRFKIEKAPKDLFLNLLKDPEFPSVAKRFAFGLGLAKFEGLLTLPQNPKILEEIFLLFKNEASQSELKNLIRSLLDSNLLLHLSEFSKDVLEQQGKDGLKLLGQSLSKNTEALTQALELAHLLNRPSEKVLSVLKEGLRTNTDIVHTLSQKWDPFFSKSLSQIIQSVLNQPEDGKPLDKKFWLELPRDPGASQPTPQFIRLYSIILSGIQKIADPRRFEPQMDSGSYRLPFQLNALFLTRLLEKVIEQSSKELEALPQERFQEAFWDFEIKNFQYRYSLAREASQDLEHLGLLSARSRLEALLREEDSGKQEYVLDLSQESKRLSEVFSEGVLVAHALKPLADVTPFLVSFMKTVGEVDVKFGPPNFLNQFQGLFAQLSEDQWQSLKKTVFEDLKLGQLEIEERALIIGLFQSDPETAEWVNEVLMRLQSLAVLDTPKKSEPGLINLYRSLLGRLSSKEITALGSALSSISQLGLLKIVESDQAFFVEASQWLTSLSKFKKSDLIEIQNLLEKTLGKNEEGLSGLDEIWDWAKRNLNDQDPKELSTLLFSLRDLKVSVSERDRKWIQEFAMGNGFQEVSHLLSTSSFRSLGSLLKEIQILTKRGTVREAMSLLSRIQNERMHEIARVIYEFDTSGELNAFLESIIPFFETGAKNE